MILNAVSCLLLRFILLLKPGRESLFEILHRQNRQTVKDALHLISEEKKKAKCDLDIKFLHTCKCFDVFPKFLRFKLYKKSLQNSKLYRTWQSALLEQEIKYKKARLRELERARTATRRLLYERLSFFQYFWLVTEIRNTVSTFIRKHEATHTRKLQRLGISNSIQPCDPDKVIFNLSSKTVPTRVKLLLAFGLDFKLPVWRLNFFNYFLCFEKVIFAISSLPLPSRFKFQEVKQRLRTIAYNYYHGFKSSKVFSSVFSKNDISLLRDFASDDSIIVTRPDKGRGVVILDKDDYKKKVTDILSDSSKFGLVKEPIHKILLQVEDKVNRLLAKLKKAAMITPDVYNELYVSGSTPGILYGLPKVHKLFTPLRPIFAACGTPTYKLAKYLVPILAPLTENQFTVKNSYQFVTDLQNLQLNPNNHG